MNCCIMSDLRRYLRKFNNILNQTANQMLCRIAISDISIDFCECMKLSLNGLRENYQNLLQYTDNEVLMDLANNQIENINNQIDTLEEIRNSTYGFINPVNDLNMYVFQYLNIARRMLNNLKNARCKCVNLTFIKQTIFWNQGNSCLCENCLQCTIDPRLRRFCENVIQSNNEIIGELRNIAYNICNE